MTSTAATTITCRHPRAAQGGALNPDGIDPGLCEDLSNPPASLLPGGGAQCEFSESDVAAICSTFKEETAPYPAMCANFNQLGFRSRLSRSHRLRSRTMYRTRSPITTSMLALIEQALSSAGHI